MSTDRDLTRWNRAGLRRFRYVDGNAATHLEELRLALLSRFVAAKGDGAPDPGRSLDWWLETWAVPPTDAAARQALDQVLADLRSRLVWKGEAGNAGDMGPLWVPVPPRPEAEGERAERLREQYEAPPRRDLAWEIVRAFARGTHVLTEHLDAYANEGFLSTATQWENVRRLAAMLDARPEPPASAATTLVLTAKEGSQGKVGKGFQVKYSPTDGGAPVIFETLDDVDVDAAVNELRPAGFDRSPEPATGSTLQLAGRVKGLRTGEPLLVEDKGNGRLYAHVVQSVLEDDAATIVEVTPPLDSGLVRGGVAVHAAPRERLSLLAPAATVQVSRDLQLTEEPAGLRTGEVVWIGDGSRSLFRRVTAVEGRKLTVDADLGALRLDGTEVGRPIAVPAAAVSSGSTSQTSDGTRTDVLVAKVPGDWTRLLGSPVAGLWPQAGGGTSLATLQVLAVDYRPVGSGAEDAGYSFVSLAGANAAAGSQSTPSLLAPPPGGGRWQADLFLAEASGKVPREIVTTLPKKTAAGDLAAVVAGGRVAWTRLGAVEVDDDAGRATLRASVAWSDRGGSPFFFTGSMVYSRFETTARLAGWDENGRPLAGSEVPLAAVPAALRAGRVVLLACLDQGTGMVAKVGEVRSASIVLEAALPAGATYGNLVIYGNAVAAGHGETREEKVLGSGDASQSGQVFAFPEKGVSFVADSNQPSGVRAGVEVRVGERVWQQVATLADSSPADPHYSVRMTEDGGIELTFGDGRNGRRLPTGTNNVRIAYRLGSGLAGNLPPGRLEKPARPHPLVAAVRQPLPATGGNDMEEAESLRATAPASISTLGRAVSLADFARLAESQSSVWQARAFPVRAPFARQESVQVVVVPAGGGPLEGLAASLPAFLEAHALPGVSVKVDPYVPVPVSLRVSLQVETAQYDPDRVVALVREQLLATFGLRSRRMGQALRLGEVYRVVEGVAGVANSVCVLAGDPSRYQVEVSPQGVAHLDAAQSSLIVTYQELEL
ncbi:MAG TPA: baseplate J/gp47 family protein [Thermoanaerobaculia bacterium]|nr:baseplate J/gp47 family protein [Thermoanaerobaculia bacterium]